MKLEKAKTIAEEFIKENNHKYERIEVVGSIRRNKPEVKDIDLIAIPKYPEKKKLIRLNYMGIQVDIYLAIEENWEVLKLIRTGSAKHNRMLCFKALSRGWKLKAGGEGLITPDKTYTTERGILEALLGKYVEPEERRD